MKRNTFMSGLVALLATGIWATSGAAYEIAEVRGDFYYDAEGQLIGHRSADLPEGLERYPMSHKEKFDLMGLELPGLPRSLEPRTVLAKPAEVEVHDRLSKNLVMVKFRDDAPVRMHQGRLSSMSRSIGDVETVLAAYPNGQLRRAFSAREDILDDNRETGQILSGRELPDLNNWYLVRFPEGSERGVALANELLALDVVETAYLQAHADPPQCADLSPTTPNYEGNQVYRDPAPNGVDIDYAWNYHAGGNGRTGYWVMDLEWDWCTSHEDLNFDGGDVVNGHTTNAQSTQDHGTAVLGVVGMCDNGYGGSGLVPDVTLKAADFDSEPSWAANIGTADTYLIAGETMILEIQIYALASGDSCLCNCSQFDALPVEYDQASFDAIETATANGIIVVEAAGNGSVDLDHSRYGNRFNRSTRDSGAILVGATDLNHNPMCWTNHGTRIDAHAFGTGVMTTGYGALFNQSGCSQDYTGSFGGTSSASPIIAGACASLQGISRDKYNVTLTPAQMRAAITFQGTNQASDFSKEVGRMPNMVTAINRIEPDLAPFQPSGWDDVVVPTIVTGSRTIPTGSLPGNIAGTYFHAASENRSYAYTSPVENPALGIYVDDIVQWQCFTGNQAPGSWAWCGDLQTSVKGGRHTVSAKADWAEVTDEYSESNNRTNRQFVWSPYSLTADVPVQRTDDPPAVSTGYVWYNAEGFKGNMSSRYWYAYGVTPRSSANDFDVRLNVEAPTNVPLAGFGASVAHSSDGNGLTDYCVVDRNVTGTTDVWASVINFSGNGAADKQVEWEEDAGTIGVGTHGPFTINTNDILELHEIYAAAGANYRVHIDWISGGADFGVAVHGGTNGYYAKNQAEDLADDAPAGADEYATIDAVNAGYRGIVVFKRGAADLPQTLTYNLVISTLPNLTAKAPTGWHGPVVPRSTNDATATFAPLSSTLNGDVVGTSFNFSTTNEGPDVASGWQTHLFVDDFLSWIGFGAPLSDDETRTWVNTDPSNDPYSVVRGGRHHLRVTQDANLNVVEFSEADNHYTEGFVWQPPVLAADTPAQRAAPPYRTPLGWGPYYSIDGVRANGGAYWTVTAATPRSSTALYETQLFDLSTGSQNGFDTPQEWAISEAYGATTFVVSNQNAGGSANHDVGILNWTGDSADYVVETADAPYVASVGAGTQRFSGHSLSAGEIVDAFEFFVPAELVGQAIYVSLATGSGAAVVDLHVFDGSDGTYTPWEAATDATSPAGGADVHAPAFSVPSAQYIAVVVSKAHYAAIDESIDFDLVISVGSGAVDSPELNVAPTQFGLAAPQPNPVRASTSIAFDIPAAGGQVDISVFDISGRKVSTLVQGAQAAGRHQVNWDGRDSRGQRATSGVYFVRMQTADFSETKKVTLLK